MLAAVAAALDGAVVFRVRDGALNQTTGLLLLAAVFATILFLAETGMSLLGASQRTRGNLRTLIVTGALLLVGSELCLRWLGKHTAYLEKNEGGRYRPMYEKGRSSWFHVYSPNIEFTHSRSEFAFPRKTNSLGLPEREIPELKPPGEYRVFAFGDSYTEGVGTPYEETWLKTVEKRLRERAGGRDVQAFNAGVSGSDPWHAYILLKEKLVARRPDLVLVAINSSDIGDVMMRGGPERFLADGTTRFTRQPPSWEWLYGISYLFRHVLHDLLRYDSFFVKQDLYQAERGQAVDQIVAAVAAFAALGREHGFELVVVLHPDKWEAGVQHYNHAVGQLAAQLKQDPGLHVVEVLDIWLKTGLLERETAADLYWEIDGHNNPKGYAAFGEAVASGLLAMKVPKGS